MTKRWGPPTWLFLHTFSTHIEPSFYESHKSEICTLIASLFNCLPCPECTKHASIHAKSLTPRNVPTKEQFQQFLFDMHNSVNRRLKKPEFSDYSQYKRANFNAICKYFYDEMLRPTGGIAFLDASCRRVLVHKIMKFMNENYSHFSHTNVSFNC